MKKIVKALSVIIAPFLFVCAFVSGCKKSKAVEMGSKSIMQDVDVPPTQTPAYEQYSRQAIAEYKAVADKHLDGDGEVDIENAEVIQAANKASAKLYAYACYNERSLDKYAWFNHQTAGTNLGGGTYANIIKQDYYLRVNESEEHCGYNYTYTCKFATEYSGAVSPFKGAFEEAKMAIITDTDTIYKFKGNTGNMQPGSYNEALGCNIFETDWKTQNNKWGVKGGYRDVMVKGDFIHPDDIEADIIKQAEDYSTDKNLNDYAPDRPWSTTIHGNINILAENVVKYSTIFEDPETGKYLIIMNIDTEVANKDEASLKMLRRTNEPSNDCKWKSGDNDPDDVNLQEDTGLRIIFSLWDNGLFYHYMISERWNGTIVIFDGTAESSIAVYYSYSDRDCDMTANLERLEEAKKLMGDAEAAICYKKEEIYV